MSKTDNYIIDKMNWYREQIEYYENLLNKIVFRIRDNISNKDLLELMDTERHKRDNQIKANWKDRSFYLD